MQNKAAAYRLNLNAAALLYLIIKSIILYFAITIENKIII